MELRHAAAALHADMLLIYTLDTTFRDQQFAEPLNVVTLGLSPTKTVTVITTASALLLDTRTGYIYGVAEATSKHDQLASAWTSDAAADQSRLKSETEAFDGLVTNMGQTWSGVVKQYATKAP